MMPPRHRPVLFFSALGLSAFALLASGCASKTKKAAADGERTPKTERYSAAMSTQLGHVISYDPSASTVLIEFGSFSVPPADLAGKALLTRNPDTLAPTGRLVAASHRTGRICGAYVVSGQPSPDDEVIIPSPF